MFFNTNESSSDLFLKKAKYNLKISIEPKTTPKVKIELFGCPKTITLYETNVALKNT